MHSTKIPPQSQNKSAWARAADWFGVKDLGPECGLEGIGLELIPACASFKRPPADRCRWYHLRFLIA
jgi:hypothetical protein